MLTPKSKAVPFRIIGFKHKCMGKTFTRYLSYIFLGLILACRQSDNPASEITSPETAETSGYKVIAIKDGDTIEILKDGKPLRVRLLGIDAPEKNQDFGSRARQFTSDLCFGKMVKLVVDGADRYGRTVGTIFLPDGRSLNAELVRGGFAWHYKAYSKDEKLARLEEEARSERRGLWEHSNPVAPWEFRKNQRTGVGNISTENVPTAPSDAAREVFICDSKGATTYHGSRRCPTLDRCKSSIKGVTRGTAVVNLRRTAHKTCQI